MVDHVLGKVVDRIERSACDFGIARNFEYKDEVQAWSSQAGLAARDVPANKLQILAPDLHALAVVTDSSNLARKSTD